MSTKTALTSGYTIVEVMMFLAISGVLMLMISGFINGQQRATEFSQGLRNFDAKISQVLNDVSTGTYTNQGSLGCSIEGATSSVAFSSGGSTQGSNQDCTFIGRVIQFSPSGSSGTSVKIYTVAGRRKDANGDIQTLNNAYVTPVVPASAGVTNTSGIDLTETYELGWGLKVTRVVTADSSHQDVAGAGFMSVFPKSSNSGTTDLLSGSQTVSLVSPVGSLNQSDSGFVGTIKSMTEADRSQGLNGLIVCFTGSEGSRKGAVTISARGQTNVLIDRTDAELGAGVCP